MFPCLKNLINSLTPFLNHTPRVMMTYYMYQLLILQSLLIKSKSNLM